MINNLKSRFESLSIAKNIKCELSANQKTFITSLPASSKEYLITILAKLYNNIIVFIDHETDIDLLGKNLRGFCQILNYKGQIIPYLFSGLKSKNFDKFIFNDQIRSVIALKQRNRSITIISKQALEENVALDINKKLVIHHGQSQDRNTLIKQIFNAGYERVDYVETPLEFAVRGGVLDVYPLGSKWPVRMDFCDAEIDFLAFFDPATQRTFQNVDQINLFYLDKKRKHSFTNDIINSHAPCIFFNEEAYAKYKLLLKNKIIFSSHKTPICDISAKDKLYDAKCQTINISKSKSFSSVDRLLEVLNELSSSNQIFLSTETDGEKQRIHKLLNENNKILLDKVILIKSDLETGFINTQDNICIITDNEIFNKFNNRKLGFKFGKGMMPRNSAIFQEGDVVVHLAYGVGIYRGITDIKHDNNMQEVMILEYANNAKLYVPREQFYLLEKYIGTANSHYRLDTLGSSKWNKKKAAASQAIDDYAAHILKMEALRELKHNTPFQINLAEIHDFEHSFKFKETIDQKNAIKDIKADLHSQTPMNRLILGDAGFGKTETAIRAAFITAINGKQTALLAPTTILAEQHYHTLKERMSEYPIRIEVLSRFTKKSKQLHIISEIKKGLIDIIIGTHRLIQKDISFKELGLLIIDEEQRFGVAHKDYLIQKNPFINILNLSATPIPRTLYLSLMGVRNLSSIMTPPVERRPIETFVLKENWIKVTEAINTEIKRNGQVFFVHNRIHSIEQILNKLKTMLPHVSFAIAHGRLHENELKQVMENFSQGNIDCLIATSIIESGLDLPNVNTLIVHQADKFGLAELYQLRGRIGRFNRKAYAYFMLSPNRYIDTNIQKRIDAISEFAKPGGGYFVALKDLEIRGAGNILGIQQSGHIAAIGFELYCKLLKDSIKTLKGESITPRYEVILNINDTGSIPNSFIASFHERFHFYKTLAIAETLEEIDNIKSELKDKFGKIPFAVQDLILTFKIKCLCRKLRILKIDELKSCIEITIDNFQKKQINTPQLKSSILFFIYDQLTIMLDKKNNL